MLVLLSSQEHETSGMLSPASADRSDAHRVHRLFLAVCCFLLTTLFIRKYPGSSIGSDFVTFDSPFFKDRSNSMIHLGSG
jgi:hypothetical protein